MKKKIYLPKSLEELKKLSYAKKSELWSRYVAHPYNMQQRALWYYIACENTNLKIERKYLTKITKYASSPDECLNENWFENINQARSILADWQTDYNNIRPHSSLNYKTPSQVAQVLWKELANKE